MGEPRAEKGGDEPHARKLDVAAFVASLVTAAVASVLARALLRGPLTTESVEASLARFPRAGWWLVGLAVAGSIAVGAVRERRVALRIVRLFAALGALTLAASATPSAPRGAFDAWERALSSTHVAPLTALLALAFAAAIAASVALSLARVVRVGSARAERALMIAAGALTFALPAAAIVYLATGTRLVPAGEPDDPWASAFVGIACPAREAPASALSAAPRETAKDSPKKDDAGAPAAR